MSAMAFIGVTTGQSMINQLFPLLAAELGVPDAELRGIDLPVDAPAGVYRDAVIRVRDDTGFAGGLITTHKLAVFHSSADLFGELDPDARRLGEISCIARGPAGLAGYAKDPTTAALALDMLLPIDYFADGGQVLCLGAGGAGTALALCLRTRHLKSGQPERIVLADVKADRLAAVGELELPGVETVLLDDTADALVAGMPAGSLIVNATGLGKDRPGSPLGGSVEFPRGATAWDFNYRGDLRFLDQARNASVRAVDGWDYFLHGWVEHITQVYDLENSPYVFSKLAEIAAPYRPGAE
jgi:shikimate 5-dehydrogenase